jgi:putative ABC transport system substrate-binding protein
MKGRGMNEPTRRDVLMSLLATAALPRSANAAALGGMKRIFMVLPRANVGDATGFQAYLAGTELTVEYHTRVVGNDPVAIRSVTKEIKAAKPDLVFTVFTQITQLLAGDATDRSTPLGDIPLVFSSVTDPVAAGVVPQLLGHGRNVTGTRHIAPLETQLNVISNYRELRQLGMIYNPLEPNMVATVNDLHRLAAERHFTLLDRPLPVERGEPRTDVLPDMIADLARAGAQFLYVGPDSAIASANSDVVAEAALANRLPTFCATELPIKMSNMLFGLVSRAYNVGGLAGHQAYQILAQGRRPDQIPIETLQRFTLILRMSVARELQFFPPMMMLKMADVNTDPLASARGPGRPPT